MAAAFIALQQNDVFYSGGNVSHLIRIPALESLLDPSALALYSDASVQLGETLQYFLTFDDVTKFIHFGKGVGAFIINGFLFGDCDSNIPGLNTFFDESVRALRGEKLEVMIGSFVCTVVMTNASVNLMSEPDTMAQFQLVFSIIHHTL